MFSSQMMPLPPYQKLLEIKFHQTILNCQYGRGFHPIADKLPQAISKEKARKALGWPQDKKIVLFFGLIRKYKGLDLLIEAFSKAPLNHSDVILAIVGEAYESTK